MSDERSAESYQPPSKRARVLSTVEFATQKLLSTDRLSAVAEIQTEIIRGLGAPGEDAPADGPDEIEMCALMQGVFQVSSSDPSPVCRRAAQEIARFVFRAAIALGDETDDIEDLVVSAINKTEALSRLARLMRHLVVRHRTGLLSTGATLPSQLLVGNQWPDHLSVQAADDLRLLGIRRNSVENFRCKRHLHLVADSRNAMWSRLITKDLESGDDDRVARANQAIDELASSDRAPARALAARLNMLK
jgi:hypothetical protein